MHELITTLHISLHKYVHSVSWFLYIRQCGGLPSTSQTTSLTHTRKRFDQDDPMATLTYLLLHSKMSTLRSQVVHPRGCFLSGGSSTPLARALSPSFLSV